MKKDKRRTVKRKFLFDETSNEGNEVITITGKEDIIRITVFFVILDKLISTVLRCRNLFVKFDFFTNFIRKLFPKKPEH